MIRPFTLLPSMMILVAALLVAETNRDLGIGILLALPLWGAGLLYGMTGATTAENGQTEVAFPEAADRRYTSM